MLFLFPLELFPFSFPFPLVAQSYSHSHGIPMKMEIPIPMHPFNLLLTERKTNKPRVIPTEHQFIPSISILSVNGNYRHGAQAQLTVLLL